MTTTLRALALASLFALTLAACPPNPARNGPDAGASSSVVGVGGRAP
jgi:hypothetical protein